MKKYTTVVLFALIVFSCSRTPRSADIVDSSTQTEPPAERPPRSITLNSQQQTPPAPPTPRVAESRPVQQRDQLLSLRGGTPPTPEDFEIGELQGTPTDSDVERILARIASFASGISEGKVPLEDIHPDWKDQAQRDLGFYLERGNVPTDMRIGLIDRYKDTSARANVRIIGNPGISLGEIYLTKIGENWLVSDLQADLADLADAVQEREGLYEPSVYRLNNLP